MNVFEEFQAVPNELLTDAQIRKKEKMVAVVSDYNELKEKYGDNSVLSINRICEILAKRHDIAVRTARYYLVNAELIKS
jgi:hypothetical protein